MTPSTHLRSRTPRRLITHGTAALAVVAIAAGLATGCARDQRAQSGWLSPYRIAIPQGNYLNQQMVAQVREGMSREQVRLAIGTPLVADPFHPDRWDYVFRYQYPNGDAELRRVTVFFESESVARVQHDQLPERDDDRDPALPGYRPPKAS